MSENATLVKFGCKQHVVQLQETGFLYMKNLPYFWQIEDRELRGDKLDGLKEVHRGTKGRVVFRNKNDSEVTVELTNWTLRLPPEKPEKIYIFCMYALRPSRGSFPVDNQNLSFGDSALVLTHPQRFIDQIHAALLNSGIKHEANLVEYVSTDYDGELGPFRKTDTYSYQSEWRLVCYDGPGDELEVEIGSIKDISMLIESKDINREIKIIPDAQKRSRKESRINE